MKDQILIFPIAWLDRSERHYYSKFARALTAITDRFDFGIMWDLNPKDAIHVTVMDQPPQERIETLRKRITAFLARQAAKEIITTSTTTK